MQGWGLREIQFAWFLTGPLQRSAADLYSSAFGSEPTGHHIMSTAAGRMGPSVAIASGQFEGADISLQAQPGRLDLFFRPTDTPDPTNLPMFDADAKVILPRLAKLTALANDLGPASRIAVVTNMMRICGDHHSANTEFGREIGLADPTLINSATDLSFTANRRGRILLGDLQITTNALVQWSRETLQKFEPQPGETVIFSLGPPAGSYGPPLEAVVASFDINTMPPERPFAPDVAITIYEQLIDATAAEWFARLKGVEAHA